MNTIKHLMRSSGFQGRVFPFSPMYSIWEIDEIIRGELYRNICMASLAITIATIFLLSDLVSACFVILCVFLTLTNVSGIMYFWGKFQLTIFAFSNIWYDHFHFSKSYGVSFNYFSFFPNIWYEHLHSSKKLGIDRAIRLWKIKPVNFLKLLRWNNSWLNLRQFFTLARISQKRCQITIFRWIGSFLEDLNPSEKLPEIKPPIL
jgi:hypothetical protein